MPAGGIRDRWVDWVTSAAHNISDVVSACCRLVAHCTSWLVNWAKSYLLFSCLLQGKVTALFLEMYVFFAVAAEYLSLQAAGARICGRETDTKALPAPGEGSCWQQHGQKSWCGVSDHGRAGGGHQAGGRGGQAGRGSGRPACSTREIFCGIFWEQTES